MRAIVTRANTDGTFDQVGMNNRFITNEYKHIRYVHRSAREFSKGRPYILEIFNSWDNRFKPADQILLVKQS